MPVDDYPTLPTVARAATGTIAGDVFTQAVAQVSIAADRGDTLPILTGVRIEIDGDKVTLLATDRYRLAMRELDLEPRGPRRQPRRARPGPHALRHRQGARRVRLDRARPRLRPAATASSASRPVSVAPRPGCSTASTPRSPRSSRPASTPRRSSRPPPCVEAVKRVALVAERNTPVRLRFTDGQVAIEAGTGDDAQASEAVEATLNGPEIEIAFNPQFLLDGLRRGRHRLRAGCRSPSRRRPAVLSGQAEADGEADTAYRYVLMPVRFAS